MPTITRAYRVALNPTLAQEQLLVRHAGASRWAYNLALSAKVQARGLWEERVQALIDDGMDPTESKKTIKVKTPTFGVIDKARVRVRGTDRSGNPCAPDWSAAQQILVAALEDEEAATRILTDWAGRCQDPARGIAPWLNEVPNSLVQRAEKDADAAWKAWLDSFAGRRAGRRVGFPRFKKRGSRDSFYLTNTETAVDTSPSHRTRTVRLGGKLGDVRVIPCPMARRVTRRLRKGAKLMSVTVSRGGHRWWASVLLQEDIPEPRPSRAAVEAGTVGVHLGVNQRATLSTGETIPNPRVKQAHTRAMVKAQRAHARTGWVTDETTGRRHPTAGRRKATARVARLAALEAARRNTHTHRISKRIATGWQQVSLLDLGVQDMTRSAARSRPRLHGWDAQAKRDANRELLDVAPYELRRQIEYKASWAGATVHVVDRGTPVTRTCSACGQVKPKPAKRGAGYVCQCGYRAPVAVNAARVLAGLAVASDNGETLNASGEDVRPAGRKTRRQSSVKLEGPRGSPPGSNPGAFPTQP